MEVSVKFLASIRKIVDAHEIGFEIGTGSTVEHLLEILKSRFGTAFKNAVGGPFEDENPKIRILVNGRDIDFLQGAKTGLKEGDTVVLIPPVAGG